MKESASAGAPGAGLSRRRGPRQRADAERNREHLLSAAAATFIREGPRVPMSRVAQAAGVGVGTLYRHFPDRDALLAALGSRAYAAVLALAQRVRAEEPAPLDALRAFLLGTIAQREVLVLPLHGAPLVRTEADEALRRAIRGELGAVLRAGQAAGSIRPDVTAEDIIITGALLAQYLHRLPDGGAAVSRAALIFVDGLRGTDGASGLTG